MIASTVVTKGGVSIRLTAGNQLIGTYAELLKYRAADQAAYSGWEAHHIFEALDVERLELEAFAPGYEQQICVLLPRRAHHRINSVLRHRNETNLAVAISYLPGDYREAYNEIDDYCGSSKAVIAKELFDIFKAVLENMVKLQDKALAKVQGDLQALLNLIALEKGLHDKLIQGSSPGALQTAGVALSFLNPVTAAIALVNPANRAVAGGFVNLFNPVTRPDLSIWAKAEAQAIAAIQALRRRDLVGAATALALSETHFKKADIAFTSWRDKIDLAGRRAQLAIGAAAIAASMVALGVFVVEGAGAAGVGASAATAGSATASTQVRVATEGISHGIRVAIGAETLAEEQAGEAIVEQSVKKMFLGR
jgi:DNA-binding ferritin-like protein (Dps family)